MVVFGLGKDLVFKSVLVRCVGLKWIKIHVQSKLQIINPSQPSEAEKFRLGLVGFIFLHSITLLKYISLTLG